MKKRMMRAMTAMCVSVGMLTGGITAMAGQYPDAVQEEWYFNQVTYVSERGIMTGYENGMFGSGDAVARGQFATIIYRMEGSPATEYKAVFKDVTDGAFYSKPAVWSNAEGIITGYEDGNFGATDSITREQLVTIMYRYATLREYDTSDKKGLHEFPDNMQVSGYATQAMEWATAVGLISGDQGKLNPQGTANRAQTATIIQRFHTYVKADETHMHTWKKVMGAKWVVDKEAFTETAPVYEEEVHFLCLEDTFDTTVMDEIKQHAADTGHKYEAIIEDIKVGTEEVFHPEEGHNEEYELTVCLGCGELK